MLISLINPYHIKPNNRFFSPKEKEKIYTSSDITDLNNAPNAQYAKISFSGIDKIQKVSKPNKHRINNYKGCITGGAIGDALGSPVEFLDLRQIKKYYGEKGIQDLQSGDSGKAEISDDTQMTMFTADGLIKAIGNQFKSHEIPDMNIVHQSYQDWLNTQNLSYTKQLNKGWVSQIPSLYEKRNPGDTCIVSLSKGKMGTMSKPINMSKGNGGVMRVAPAGLLYYNNPKIAFEVGARCAAITHGHPSGYLSAGVFASILSYIAKGENIESSVDKSIRILEKYSNHEEVKDALLKAKDLAKTDIKPEEAIHEIGGGWVGEEAIAIAVYCALKSPDNFEEAVKMAVNHNGDSDSTGAITGNIMGLYLGETAIPDRWKEKIELSNELKTISSDLYYAPFRIQKVKSRYPYNMGRVPNWYVAPHNLGNATRLHYVKFSPKDEARMQTMSTQDMLEYKKYLIRNKLYFVDK